MADGGADRRRWHNLGDDTWELSTAAVTLLVEPDHAPELMGAKAYVVTLVVAGQRFRQNDRYEGPQSLLLARIAAVAQGQAVITRSAAQLRCAAVDLNREITKGADG